MTKAYLTARVAASPCSCVNGPRTTCIDVYGIVTTLKFTTCVDVYGI